MQCPICEYPKAHLRYQMSDRFFQVCSDEFMLYECNSCGLVFQDENMIKDRLEEFYPPGYWWQSYGKVSGLERVFREWVVRHDQLRFLNSLCPDQRGRLLDIGCGSATFVKLALQDGFKCAGNHDSTLYRHLSPTAARFRCILGCLHSGDSQGFGRPLQMPVIC